jgi:hypothetical protein
MNANRGCRARFGPFFAAGGFVLLHIYANPVKLCQTTDTDHGKNTQTIFMSLSFK